MTGSIKKLIFLLLILVMFMTGCTDPNTIDTLGEEVLNKIQLSETFDETFILPTEIDGYEINWISKNPDIMSNAGIAYCLAVSSTWLLPKISCFPPQSGHWK